MKILIFIATIFTAMAIPSAAQSPTGAEVITVSDAACTATTLCSVQLYRATGKCPVAGPGTLTWTELASALLSSASVSQTFTYSDTTAAEGTTYCYYATATYLGNVGYPPSNPSANFEVAVPFATPSAPSMISGVWTPGL